MEEQSNFEIKNKITPTGHEFEAKAKVPQEAVTELVLATTRCIDSIRKGSERVGAMLSNSSKAIGKPIGAYLEGKSNEISANSQLIVANIMYKKEINAIKHLQYISEELNQKVAKGEDIPEKIEESDKLYLIQDNASTTSNDEFLKLWAKLYAEEACKPNTVSRKTIKLFESMEPKIIRILENEIFPYCDESGFYFGDQVNVSNLIIAMDYGMIDNFAICKNPRINTMWTNHLTDDLSIYCYPNYAYSSSQKGLMYKLTISGLEICKILKISKSKKILDIMFNNIEKAAEYWNISEALKDKVKIINQLEPLQKFVICDNSNTVIYPIDSQFKNLDDFYKNAMNNFEVVQND